MRRFLTTILALFVGCTLFGQGKRYQRPVANRVVKTINTQWTFNYFPEEKAENGGYEDPALDDSEWSYVAIPHTWQTYETTRELHPYIRNVSAKDDPYWWNGWGWYRKHLVIGKEYAGRNVYLEFDGVQKYSKVYVNGHYLGDHKGGFTSFYMDATEAIRFGEDNVIVVAVNNALNDRYNIPPMNAGNWSVYGGIVRDVRLVITDRLNVPYQGSYKHEGGTFITTPFVSSKSADVQIKTYVQNNFSEARETRVVTYLANSNNIVFDRQESRRMIRPGEIAEFVQHSAPVKNPNLWSPQTPYIYNAYTEVYDGKRLADTYHSTFGIRSIAWDYDLHRLILNGEVTHLHGINRHEEYIWLGQAFPKWIAERDLNDIAKGLEVNYMRTAHYPNAPYVYYFMDQNGICINEELPNIKNQEFDPVVQEQNCREMIRRDRNHPSIIIWSMGNETDHACDSRYAWEEDKSRIITVRQPYNDSYNPVYCPHTDAEMPVESFLRCTIRGWYDVDDRNQEPDDQQWAGTDNWQHVKSNEYNMISNHNGTVWLYADHGADREYVGAPLKHVNPKGWVDSWRTPKYVYYLWQANFAKKPMVFIMPHFWRSQYIGQKKDFTVDSNCEQVELFVNGKSQGILYPTKQNNYNVTFKDILVEQGTIEAVASRKDGTRVADKVVMAGEPAALTIVPTATRMMSSPDNIIEFRVDAVDKNGVHVYGANPTLKFHVEGPAKLIGPEIYLSDRDKTEEYEGTMYIDVPVTNLIRAVGKTGKVKITVSATGLDPASTEIDVVAYQDPAPVSGIVEPVVDFSKSKPVSINTMQANYIKAPVEMLPYQDEISFPIADQVKFRELVSDYVVKRNPTIDTRSPEFGYVLDAFEAILNSTARFTGKRGYVVADDSNFLAGQYNTSRAITKNISSKNLPRAYKDMLIEYYAHMIVAKGKDKNYLSENYLIDRIPNGGTAIVIASKGDRQGVKYLNETDLKKVMPLLYPEFASLSQDKQKEAMLLVTRINPGATFTSVRDKKTKNRTDFFTLAPESVILIPDFKALTKSEFPDKEL